MISGMTRAKPQNPAHFQPRLHVTRDTTLRAPIDDAESIRDAVRSCLKRVPLDARLRLLGVRIAALVAAGQGGAGNSPTGPNADRRGQSLSLFD